MIFIKNRNIITISLIITLVVLNLCLYLLLKDYYTARIIDIVVINALLMTALYFNYYKSNSYCLPLLLWFAIFATIAGVIMIILNVSSILFTILVYLLIFGFSYLFVKVDLLNKDK